MNLLDFKRGYERKYDEMLSGVLDELSAYFTNKYICKLIDEPQFVKHHQLFHWVDKSEIEKFSYFVSDYVTYICYDGTIRLSKDTLLSINIQFNYLDFDEFIFDKFSITYINYGKYTYCFNLFDDEYDPHDDPSDDGTNENRLNELYKNEDTHFIADIIDYFIFNANKLVDDIENTFIKMATTNYLSYLPSARTILLIGKYHRIIPYDIAKIISKKILFFLFFVITLPKIIFTICNFTLENFLHFIISLAKKI